jgi:peroxiredoxin
MQPSRRPGAFCSLFCWTPLTDLVCSFIDPPVSHPRFSHLEMDMSRLLCVTLSLLLVAAVVHADEAKKPAAKKKVDVGTQAPEFKIKDASGKTIDLAELTAKGPVLVRLTCGCSGCDKELAYFQALHEAYKSKGLISLAVFKEPDAKVAAYVKTKKLDMLYAVDTKGDSWNVFQTRTMPTNFLIDKGGKIVAIAAGCDPSGLVAKKLADKVASTIKTVPVDVKKKVDQSKK